MAMMYATLYGNLLNLALLDRLEFSRLAMSIESMTANNGGCELLEADISELWETFNSTSAGHTKRVTAEILSKIWSIDHKMAEKTLQVTNQLNRNGDNTSLARNLGTNDPMLRYRSIKSHFSLTTCFVTGKEKSTRGYSCMQIFVSGKGFVKVYPMTYGSEFPVALREFLKDVGVPDILVADPHCSNESKEVKAFCTKIGTTLRLLENNTQWVNCAELYVGIMKEGCKKDIKVSGSPLVLWDYAAERCASILYLTTRDLFQIQGGNPYTETFGEEGDKSNFCQFAWYEWVYIL